MEFEKRKKATLESISTPEPDKSPKGTIDTPIIPLLNTINSHNSYFTTSSCSGRISILSQPISAANSIKKKAKGGNWVYITHNTADPNSVINHIFTTESTQSLPHSLVFRFEPLIIAVECRDIDSAQNLVSIAISCGFRESGITNASKRVIVAIRCSIRMEVPLGDTHKILVNSEYVKYLVQIANEKMEANRRRTDRFLDVLISHGFQNSSINGKEENGGSVVGIVDKSLTIVKMGILGVPLERLYIWGHTCCVLNLNPKKLIVFGGFGGIGSHARRNDSLLLDSLSGELEVMNAPEPPSPRLGHTCTAVGDSMFVIGGRAGPTKILNDVFALNVSNNRWTLINSTGCDFPPRHRHAAAAIGSKIYVFGGIRDDVISSSLYVFDTNNFVWSKIANQGEWPCPRHSHSLVSYRRKLYMFGGFNGDKVLGDLYSFDVETCLWKKEKTQGETPYARFSHSMFVYKSYIGIIGGCPIKQHYQELSLLDLRSFLWNHMKINSVGEDLFVRSTASVVGDDIVMIGGGASCYAFGTKFSEPMKLNLLPLLALENSFIPDKTGDKHIVYQEKCEDKVDGMDEQGGQCLVLKLERKYAKLAKDVLKKFGWLDLERKVYSQEDGTHICFPITGRFCSLYRSQQNQMGDPSENNGDASVLSSSKILSLPSALNLLMTFGATIMADEIVKVRKSPISPLKLMSEAVANLLNHRGLPESYLEQLPSRWERLGDIVVLPETSFKDSVWDSIGDELWPIVAKSLGTRRLARQGRVASNGTRDSRLEILIGENGWVDHRENGILYSFDATKCMFSWGNLSEKLRMGSLQCNDDVIVDLFAGIGYFVLPFLVRAKAKLVYACEWNPHAIEALKRNLNANSVADRCVALEGDNRITAPKGVADRVCLGLLPTSEGSWVTAVKALRKEGGVLHVHDNVKDTEENSWSEHVCKSITEIARSEGYNWEVKLEHVERVKWYAPHIRHLVADIRCKQTTQNT